MRYLGGKTKLAKRYIPAMEQTLADARGVFYEPFVGGFNLVPALGERVISAHCSDTHTGLIAMYHAIQAGWAPPGSLSELEYASLRNADESPLRTFAAFACSFGGKEWGGYARDRAGLRNFAAEQQRFLAKKSAAIVRSSFAVADYRDLSPSQSVIYCDPPYTGTTGYANGGFDHAAFYKWCERMAADNAVFVSEFTIPERKGWDPVLTIPRKSSVRRNDGITVNDYLIRVHA